MTRNLALRIALALTGSLFVALAWPMVLFLRQEPALSISSGRNPPFP